MIPAQELALELKQLGIVFWFERCGLGGGARIALGHDRRAQRRRCRVEHAANHHVALARQVDGRVDGAVVDHLPHEICQVRYRFRHARVHHPHLCSKGELVADGCGSDHVATVMLLEVASFAPPDW